MKKPKSDKEVGVVVEPLSIPKPFPSGLTSAKRVKTYDGHGKENGFLIELGKKGKLTTTYLTAIYPGAFKGYHLHRVRIANYVCIRGSVKIILYLPSGRQEYILSEENDLRLSIPTNVPTGLSNESGEEAWIINVPEPAYDPDLKGEQVDFTQEQMAALFDEPKDRAAYGRAPIETLPYASK